MTDRQTYHAWAPAESPWSPWVKPVLFAALPYIPTDPAPPLETLAAEAVPWLRDLGRHAALVLDLPGRHSTTHGLQLTAHGYRPIPLFNTTYGVNAIVPVREIAALLLRGRNVLEQARLPAEAPPAFLLDADRQSAIGVPAPGKYDNRWITFPQDFPSGHLLRARGISVVVLWQTERTLPRDDLAHVLLRWQEAGLAIYAKKGPPAEPPQPITVQRPRHFRSLWHRLFALTGLRRNAAGGFGSIVPEAQSGYG